MRELGEGADAFHDLVGRLAAEKKVDCLIAVGKGGEHIRAGAISAGMAVENTYLFYDPDEFEKIASLLHEKMSPGDVLLVKASRGLRTERIIEAFKSSVK